MAEIDLIKISELPATSTIGDADELAVVQGGATKKVPYSVLKDGAEVTPDTTLSEAGVPADAAAVGTALAQKANQAAVTQALAAKADKTEVAGISDDIAELASVVERKADQTALNQKADKTTTDALRQDLTTLNGIVNQKADKTELNAQIGNVTAELATKANTADVNNLLAAKANVASPVFTGRPQAPTAPKGTATLQLATTAFVQNAIDDKEDKLTFDQAPTQGSTNPVTSGGVYTAVESAKADAEEAATEAKNLALGAYATPTASGSLITLTDGADGIPAKKLTLSLSPHQSGSGDPSPDNVRPISGYESVTVTRAGKNLVNCPETTLVMGVNRTVSAPCDSVLPPGTYTITATVTASTTTKTFNVSARNGQTSLGSVVFAAGETGRKSATLTTDAPITRLYCYLSANEVEGSSVTFTDVQLEAGDTATAYEEYITPDTYPITIPTAAGTVYGGNLEINEDGSGTLTVDRAMWADDGTANWERSADGSFYVWNRTAASALNSSNNGACNYAKYEVRYGGLSAYARPSNSTFVLGTSWGSYFDTVEALKAAFSATPFQIVYPLASPQTYTLTADQVTTLLGDNTVWMDADGSIDLTYRADTEKYVERRIAEVQALVLENNG